MTDLLQRAIAEVYETAASGQFIDLLPDIVARTAGARSCVVQKTDRKLAPTGIAQCWFTPKMTETYIAERIFLDDVWANCAVEHGVYDRAINIGEVVGCDRYIRSRFYQDFIRRFGDDTGHCLGALLNRPEGGFLTYGTHRATRAETFSKDEVRLFTQLNPHFLRAASIDEKIAGGWQTAGHMRAVLDRLERPLVTVSPARKVVLANPAAEAIVARRDGLLLSGGGLTALDPSSQQRLARATGSALTSSGQQGGNLLVERGGGKPPYRLTVTPLVIDGITHAMILIDDPDSEPLDAIRRLSQLYGFTGAEAEVAILVAQGHSAEEIAVLRGVGLATVKTLLQRCFRKSDASRATQLARLVNRLPR